MLPHRVIQRVRSVDALFGVLATLFGSVSLFYPFGRDQGLFYYAAREWLLRGQVLYRDVWDHKPPIIYFIHMATIVVFGQHVWGIRVLELFVAVPLLAWLTARLASSRGTPVAEGSVGAAWVGVALYHYGYQGFWDTGQCEIWAVLFATAALVAALHGKEAVRGAFSAGALSGIALFTKPPIVFFVVLSLAAVALRARSDSASLRDAGRRLSAWALGGLAVGGAIFALFAVLGALRPMLDILVGANGVYVDRERSPFAWTAHAALYFALLSPFSTVFVVCVTGGVFVGFALRDRPTLGRYLTPAALLAATCGGVFVQFKFFQYHWGTAVAASGLLAASLYVDMSSMAKRRGAGWLAPVTLLGVTGFLYAASGAAVGAWFTTARATVQYLTGTLSREEFSRNFDVPSFYSNHDAELVGLWLRAHASHDDRVLVRGFEPAIYATSGLYYSGRFFWTSFLNMPTREYRRQEWLDEDYNEVVRNPPHWAVARPGSGGIDSPEWLEALGYSRRSTIGSFTILERRFQ